MLQSKSFSIIAVLCALPALSVNLASIVQRQEAEATSASNERTFFPVGEQTSNGELESTIPIQCSIGCANALENYFYCFISDTLLNGNKYDRSTCPQYICNQTLHDQSIQCLNCIIANGEERPTGYHTNTSLTVQPTSPADSPQDRVSNPNGLVDQNQANQILQNITEYCNGVGSSLSGETSVTATPTTTGPYYTSWTSGQVVSLTNWEGLANYTSNPVYTVETRNPLAPTSSVTGPSQTSSGSASASPSSQTAAGVAGAPSSTSSTTSGASRRLRILWFNL